jgi:hypothetical protein
MRRTEGTSITEDELEKLWHQAVEKVMAERTAAGSTAPPTFRSEDEFVAHIVAECAKLGVTGTGIEDALRGLAGIFKPPGGYQEVTASKPTDRHEQLRVLNSNELNQACRKYLGEPVDDMGDLYCLSLALWGVAELDVRLPAGSPTEGELLEMLDCLMHWPPAKAYEWLTNENGTYGEDVFLTARELADLDPESAACVILDAIGGRMDELGPDRFA